MKPQRIWVSYARCSVHAGNRMSTQENGLTMFIEKMPYDKEADKDVRELLPDLREKRIAPVYYNETSRDNTLHLAYRALTLFPEVNYNKLSY